VDTHRPPLSSGPAASRSRRPRSLLRHRRHDDGPPQTPSHNTRSRSHSRRRLLPPDALPIEADALHLPLADASVDLVTSAFGFRNLANYHDGLAEILRVLRPGGQLGILECNQPEGLIGAIYNIYFKSILPRLGGLITGNQRAYSYLNASVERFPRPPRMIELLRNAGFADATWTGYTFGVVGLYHATKP
jgi:demethylmenaquinone methyltransferase/2-methoxy-6-polyprenyl-1,4-benzoquinol methylase